jgi:cbb3-type cytochrome oxidase maturation protein
MEILVFLVPLALMLGLAGLAAFLWSLRSGQYDDLDGAAWRAIADDDDETRSLQGLAALDSVKAGANGGLP